MDDEEVVEALSALAQTTRLRAYRAVVAAGTDGISAGEVARELGISNPGLSGHMAILTRAGVVSAERHGRSVIYRACAERLRDLAASLVEDGRGPGAG